MTLSKKAKDLYLVGGGFSQDARTVFDLMDTEPPSSLKVIMATGIDALVANGDWDNMNSLLIVLDTLNNSLINWKGGTNAVAINSPVFTAFEAITFDGATNHIDTQISSGIVDDNYSGVYINQTSQTGNNRALFGARASTRFYFIRAVSGIIQSRNHLAGIITMQGSNAWLSDGYYSHTRRSLTDHEAFINGISVGTDTTLKTNQTNTFIFIGAYSNVGSPTEFWAGGISGYIRGNSSVDDLFVHTTLKTMIDDIRLLA